MTNEIGKKLTHARELQRKTIEEIAKDLYIKPHYLRAIEQGEIEIFTSKAHRRGFLRSYAEYLQLDADALLEMEEPQPEETIIDGELEKPEEPAPEYKAKLLEIGSALKEQRDLLELTLEEIEEETHLREYYLHALETGDLESLPSPVQGRGMLKNYAVFIGMDPEPLLLLFADALQLQHKARQQAPEEKQKRRTSNKLFTFLGSDVTLSALLVLMFVVIVAWGGVRILSEQAKQTPEPTAPSIVDVLFPTETSSNIEEPLPTGITPIPNINPLEPTDEVPTLEVDITEEPTPAGAIQLQVVIRQNVWLRVSTDREIVFEGRMMPGTTKEFTAEELIEIYTSNAAGVIVFFNGNEMGGLGLYGEIVRVYYDINGQVAPTPTITPIPTRTPRPSNTPNATPTP